MIFTFTPYIWASGGQLINADGTQATLASSPPVKAALQFYNRLWTEGVVDPGAKVDSGSSFFSNFETGKVGMQGTGAFASSPPNITARSEGRSSAAGTRSVSRVSTTTSHPAAVSRRASARPRNPLPPARMTFAMGADGGGK